MNILELSEQEIGRREALAHLREMGIEPYPAAEYPVNAYSTEIKSSYKDGEEPREVCIAGRMMSRRVMGKASFAEIMDSKGRIQVYITRDDICPGEDKTFYTTVFKKLLDLGDFVGVKGYVFRTQTGEISVHARELTLLAKSVKPLPVVKERDGVVYDAFDDAEMRYRQRYVDLIVNPGVKETFEKRSRVFKSMRDFFDKDGYMEVETPILQPIPGGASARPFITHHNALNVDLYLRIACELYLKRLNPMNNWAFSLMSQLYVALPFALLSVLAFHRNTVISDSSPISFNAILPLSVFIFNWSNDTGAYCTGMLFGRHRLFERISPKKSWEGSIGGGIISILVSLVMAHFFPFLSVLQWIGFALVVVVFGTWGDLVESLLKRQLGIKDSGNILPGHGGMLDRFDSTLLAVPAVVLYLYTLTLL